LETIIAIVQFSTVHSKVGYFALFEFTIFFSGL